MTPISLVLLMIMIHLTDATPLVHDVGTLPRRYDVDNLGIEDQFHGWADVQGQGAAHDYCRMIGDEQKSYLSCALAGTQGEDDNNYVSDTENFDKGYANTWFMRDEDGDGRDDYCRCATIGDETQVVCTKAGPKGFYGSIQQGGATYTFTTTGDIECSQHQVRPEFGRAPQLVIVTDSGLDNNSTGTLEKGD